MTALRNPDTGSIIQATGGLEQRLRDKGWVPTDEPPAPGLRIVTAAELEALTSTVQTTIGALQEDRAGLHAALSASQADRADLRSMLTPVTQQLPEVAAEVDQLVATVEAPTTAAAPKPTPRTDALEEWSAWAQSAIDDISVTVAAIDLPAAVNAWISANPPPAGSPGDDGADGKSAYQIARDRGYGGTETQWLATLVGPQGPPGAASTVPGPAGPASTVPGPKGDKGDTGAASTVPGPPGADSTVPGPPGPPGTTDYTQLTNKPTLGSAASKDTGTGAANVILGNDTRLTDARTPSAHTHPVAQVTGLHAVATTGAYSDLSGKPTSMAPTAHTHPVAEVTGLHAVATSGDYNALANKPSIPAAVVARAAVVASGALTANVVKNVTVTWASAMPSATYAISAVPVSTAPNTLNTSIVSQTAAGCVIAIRSTAAVGGGVNLHCIAVA